MQRRGLVLIRFYGKTKTATTNDPLGTPERGSSSTRTENCMVMKLEQAQIGQEDVKCLQTSEIG